MRIMFIQISTNSTIITAYFLSVQMKVYGKTKVVVRLIHSYCSSHLLSQLIMEGVEVRRTLAQKADG